MTKKERFIAQCKANPHWKIFSQDYWFEAINNNNWDVFEYKFNEEIIFYLPCLAEKKGIYTLLRNAYLTPYSELLCTVSNFDITILEKVWHAFLEFTMSFDFIELDFYKPLPFSINEIKKQFDIVELRTNLLELTKTTDEIFNNFKQSLQRHLKFAKNNLIIKEDDDSKQLFELLENNEAQKKLKNIYTKTQLENLYTICKTNNSGKIFSIENKNGITQAALFLTWHCGTAYYILGSSLQPKSERGAMSALLWQSIQFAKEQKNTIFDFEGSLIKSIDTFFKTFGTIEKSYYRIQKYNSVTLKLAMKLKEKFNN